MLSKEAYRDGKHRRKNEEVIPVKVRGVVTLAGVRVGRLAFLGGSSVVYFDR